MSVVTVEGSSHWYTKDGVPCHEVPRAGGEGMRPATVRDARKIGLYPSVTNILSVLNKPYLNAWKATQYIEAFVDVVSSGGEGDRVAAAVELAEQRMAVPRDTGTAYHAAFADLVRMFESEYAAVPPRDVPVRTLAAFAEWYTTHCRDGRSETPFASPFGYGGCVDWHGFYCEQPGDEPQFAILDWKTQSTEPGKKVKHYTEWPVQLAAYARGLGVTHAARLINVVISTTEPGRIEVVEWDEGVEFWFARFNEVFAVWRGALGRNYDPREE